MLGWLWSYQAGPAPTFPLIQAMFAGTRKIDDITARVMLNGSTHIRANPTFDQTWPLDDCSAIDKMNELTGKYISLDEWKCKAEPISKLAQD